MIFQSLKKYKWQVLGSVIMASLYVISSLLQPRFLQDVLAAVSQNDSAKIYHIGVMLLLVAALGLIAGAVNT